MNLSELNVLLNDLLAVSRQLSSQEKWTKGSSARDKNGDPVCADDFAAVQWCLSGAIERNVPVDIYLSSPGNRWGSIVKALKGEIAKTPLYRSKDPVCVFISAWNDDPETTFEDIQWIIGSAITATEKEIKEHND